MRLALDTNLLAYAEGVGDAQRCQAAHAPSPLMGGGEGERLAFSPHPAPAEGGTGSVGLPMDVRVVARKRGPPGDLTAKTRIGTVATRSCPVPRSHSRKRGPCSALHRTPQRDARRRISACDCAPSRSHPVNGSLLHAPAHLPQGAREPAAYSVANCSLAAHRKMSEEPTFQAFKAALDLVIDHHLPVWDALILSVAAEDMRDTCTAIAKVMRAATT